MHKSLKNKHYFSWSLDTRCATLQSEATVRQILYHFTKRGHATAEERSDAVAKNFEILVYHSMPVD